MSSAVRKSIIILIAFMMIVAEPVLSGFYGVSSDAFAVVGSVAEGEEVEYGKSGGVLGRLGFDTSKMPDDYDPDATTNPYGSDVSTLSEVEELLVLQNSGSGASSKLYGHNKNIDGKYETFKADPLVKSGYISFLSEHDYVSAVKCDITGDGRDSAIAIAYTHYTYTADGQGVDSKVYMRIIDPVNDVKSDEFVIADLGANRLLFNYIIQSQIQITAGDYDKDSIDEIAVYAPSGTDTGRNRVTFFDLIDGKECQNPYSKASWRESWNYMLPVSDAQIINCSNSINPQLGRNIYNNLDLTSGDADNDGICDLIVSYGASSIKDYGFVVTSSGQELEIVRSIPSKSVLLYGSDSGQMLRDSQEISYGGQNLIRVSFAFGDIDDDGNEDMFIAGQMQNEQDTNTTRVLGKYVYDSDAGGMDLESIQDIKVVDGAWSNDNETFSSSNGWDGYYHSAPLMKANIAVGEFFGAQSDTKIYLDSVLYTYDDGRYDIADELEDDSKVKKEDSSSDGDQEEYKGSHVFTDMKGYFGQDDEPSSYYEYGADAGNFTGGLTDCAVVSRIAVWSSSTITAAGKMNVLHTEIEKKDGDSDTEVLKSDEVGANSSLSMKDGSGFFAATADTDRDSLVAEYTGVHNIVYDDPEVLAVLASAPYFKDVAAYDRSMLDWCETAYGTSVGNSHGHKDTYESNLGAHLNTSCGSKEIYGIANVETGWSRAEEWGWEKSYEFEMDYSTAGGEDAVVLYSVPAECYVYMISGVTVDDNGQETPFNQEMIIKKDHKPVVQTLTLDDYMAIQGKYSDKLPDITKYLTSTPGEPDTYPKSENDLSEKAKKAQKRVESDPIINELYRVGEQWCGVGYGSGTETQSFTFSHEERERYRNHMDGWYGVVEAGLGDEHNAGVFFEAGEAYLHYDFNLAHGYTNASLSGSNCSCTVANMPMAAKGYGYDFSWKLFRYLIEDNGTTFPVITYIVNDVQAPPELPDNIMQDFDITTDSQIGLTWTYNHDNPQGFDVYRYEDFPQGGGDKLIATVGGSSYRIMKDDNGNTLKDKDGHVIRKYTFTDTDLTADTKYSYRLKVRRTKIPQESIYSPVIEARTDVGTRPDISLSTDSLTIYHDSTYEIKANLADPEHYQKDISYQWQKFNSVSRTWEDVKDCDKQRIIFYNCDDSDAGNYRCRMNLIRKIESHPQYISAFTEPCEVKFSLRSAKFEGISVYSGTGSSDINTGISVKVINADKTSLVKPEGRVTFTLRGPNGDFVVAALIDAKTGIAKVDSIEDKIGSIGQQYFVDGGYQITARYEGNDVFYAADDTEEYHYLRNIGECKFLSVKSLYQFGEDIAETASLWDYKLEGDEVIGTNLTSDMSVIKFYQVDEHDRKTGDPVAEYTLSETDDKAPVPLNSKIIGKAYVEAYVKGETGPAAGYVIRTAKADVSLSVTEKLTGTGDLIEFLSSKDVTVTEGIDPEEKNIVTANGKKSLTDFLLFEYYEQNGELVCTSKNQESHKSDFIPASYYAKLKLTGDDVAKFYKATYNGARFMVVGNYFEITAGPEDKSAGYVKMISPDKLTDFEKKGYPGGTKIVLKAVPNKGFEVIKWTVDDCGISSTDLPGSESITYTVSSRNTDGTGEVKIKAVMKPKNNRLTMHTVGSGQITVTPNIENDAIVLAGTKLNFTAEPDAGWRFDEWHWINDGGNNIVSGGFTADDGTNTKTFTMQDNSAEVYGVFVKDSIDLLMSNDLMASYINDGSNPHYDYGETVPTERGRDVPKGTIVTVSLKPGVRLAPGSTWDVTIGTDEGIMHPDIEEVMVEGRAGCRFRIPDNVVSCMVTADTERGTFSVDTWGDDIDFAIKVDGSEVEGGTIDGIQSGSQVDIQAKPARGKVVKNWIVNGEKVESKDTIYSFNITDNMNITAETEADEAFSVKVKAEGGGEGEYVITDKNGAEIKETFGADEATITVYKGESVLFRSSENEGESTMTSLYLDGEMKSLDDGEFTLSDISEDAEVVCRFSSNSYYDVTFYKTGKAVVPDVRLMNYHILNNGDTVSVSKGGTLEFSVFMEDEFKNFVVTKSGEKIDYYQKKQEQDIYRYNFRIENITRPEEIVVSDYETIKIYDEDDLFYYFDQLYELKDRSQIQPSAILMNDIDVTKDHDFSNTALHNCGTFDGQNHTISGLRIGSESDPVPDFMGLFGGLDSGAEIKDVAFKDLIAYVDMPTGGIRGVGLLTMDNYGTIDGVAVIDSELHVVINNKEDVPSGVITSGNVSSIKNCMVSNVSIESDATTNHAGSAGARYNDTGGHMEGNYFENICVKGADSDEYVPVQQSVVVQEGSEYNSGVFTDNIFKAEYGVTDTHGANVFELTEHPDNQEAAEAEAATPEFVRRLAYRLNQAGNGKKWGTAGPDNAVLQLNSYISDGMKAPVKVDFVPKDGADAVSMYCYPDDNVLPGREIFGDDTPKAWMIGGRPYTPGAYVDFDEDTVCTGIEQVTGYTASLSIKNDAGDIVGSTFYKTLNEAITDAMQHKVIGKQELRILGNCQLSGTDFVVDEDTTLSVRDGVVFTMRKGSQIINKGSMIVEQGATIHKYGGILNLGTMIVADGSELYNYGSTMDNKGILTGAGNIICKPHIFGEWKYSDEPDDEGKWSRTSTCTVCLKEVTEEVQPDPPEIRVKSIELMSEPNKTAYETGEKFSIKGMRVVANLTDDTRTAVTKYTMTLSYDGDEEIELKDGDPLIVEGDAKVNVKYGKFQTSFDIIVMNTADNLIIRGDDENEITEAELMPTEKIALHAALKRKLPYKTAFRWESTDSSVLLLGSETGKDVTVTAGVPGTAEIIVTVVDENGKRIEAIQEKTVSISVVSHITAISIVGEDASIEKGDTYRFETKVTPEDTTDEIKWTSSDPDVAEVDEVTGTVTGKRGGKALITATAPNGLSDSRTVYVSEKAESLDLEPEALTVNKGGFSAISARVQNAYANGEVRWTVADDSTAGFCVRNKETGEMEIVKETTTSLSSDGKESSDTYVIVAGVSGGEVTVKASTEAAGGALLEKECAVTVTDSEQAVYLTHNGARISGEHMTLALDGQFIRLGAESTEDDDTFTWSVIDDNVNHVLKVDNEGGVTLLRKGTGAVQVVSEKTGCVDVCMIKVIIEPAGVILSENELDLIKGQSRGIIAKLQPEEAEGRILWTSSDESVATVSENGIVKAVGSGTAAITAQPDAEGAKPSVCEVKVYESELTVELSKKSFTYDGKKKVPAITVKNGSTVLGSGITKSNENVIVIMQNSASKLPGTYQIVVIARESHYGTGEAKYTISVKPTSLRKVTRKRKAFTAKWKKVSKKYFSGYQIRYSLKKNMKKSKIKTVKSPNKASLTVKKLKGGKKYYVQVRTFVKRRGVRYVSKWSKQKTVKVKK